MRIIRSKKLAYTPASHEDPQDPGVYKKVLAQRTDFPDGRVQMVNWARLPHGKAFRNHYHETLTELFIIIHGKVRGVVDGREFTLDQGDALLVAPYECHTLVNIAPHDSLYVVIGITDAPDGKTVVV